MKVRVLMLIPLVMLSYAKHATSEIAVPDVECAAYWQLKTIGLRQEHSIAAAKASEIYEQQYIDAKQALTFHLGVEVFTRQFYDALKVMLEQVGDDLSRVDVLDTQYQPLCAREKGLNK
ncbi:hypothetical protein R50072_03180 [Simiduia litorea]|uniref:hypothetical protein n=1 Tax=Simiduia litorea TaxID=1435348 RepID=UPI0036F3E38C